MARKTQISWPICGFTLPFNSSLHGFPGDRQLYASQPGLQNNGLVEWLQGVQEAGQLLKILRRIDKCPYSGKIQKHTEEKRWREKITGAKTSVSKRYRCIILQHFKLLNFIGPIPEFRFRLIFYSLLLVYPLCDLTVYPSNRLVAPLLQQDCLAIADFTSRNGFLEENS